MGAVGVLIMVILSHLLHSRSGYTKEVCTRGWFGSRCQYKCRCASDRCNVDGSCTSRSTCRIGWFGPACQYCNLVYIGKSWYDFRDITDENDSPCNTQENFKYMSKTWDDIYHFSWLRLRVSIPGVGHLINVSITNNGAETTCADLTRVAIDDHTLDIHCPTSVLMNKIELEGNGVTFVCSLYISGGRNVALKEKTRQSSTYTDNIYNLDYSKSDNAVDGNPSGNFEEQSCAHTGEHSNPTWSLSLTTPRLVNRYDVHNKAPVDTYGNYLDGFILESYNTRGDTVLQYRNDQKAKFVYTIRDTNIDQQVHSVRIYLNHYASLALCEVELYGDSVCPHGRYGRDCEHTCNCDNKSDSCFVSTGGCPSGCPAGFYGEGCRQVCDIGRYGKGCTEMCGYKCAKVACDAINGVCVDGCSQGYKPPFCNEECDFGFHGYNCTEPCSNNCNGSCNKETGSCLNGCLSGYVGAQCDKECDFGFHGYNCTEPCSNNCNGSCDKQTGFCLNGCLSGYEGAQCDKALPVQEQEHIVMILVPAGGFVVMVTLTVIGVLIWRRRRYTKDGPVQTGSHIHQNNAEINSIQMVTPKPNKAGTKQTKPAVIKKPNDGQDNAQQHHANIGYCDVASRYNETSIDFTDQSSSTTESRKKCCQEQFNVVPASTRSTGAAALGSVYQHPYREANTYTDNPYDIPMDSTRLTQKERRLKPEDHMTYANSIMPNLYDTLDEHVPNAYEDDL